MLPSWRKPPGSQKLPTDSTSGPSSGNQWHSKPGFPIEARRRIEQEERITYDHDIFKDWDSITPAAVAGRWHGARDSATPAPGQKRPATAADQQPSNYFRHYVYRPSPERNPPMPVPPSFQRSAPTFGSASIPRSAPIPVPSVDVNNNEKPSRSRTPRCRSPVSFRRK